MCLVEIILNYWKQSMVDCLIFIFLAFIKKLFSSSKICFCIENNFFWSKMGRKATIGGSGDWLLQPLPEEATARATTVHSDHACATHSTIVATTSCSDDCWCYCSSFNSHCTCNCKKGRAVTNYQGTAL